MEDIDGADYGSAATNTADGLTRVMILHPIACAIAFLAFAFSLGAGVCGKLFAAALSLLAWIVTLVVMVTDFVSFGIVKDKVNGDGSGSIASFEVGMWTILVAMVLLFWASVIVLMSICIGRRRTRMARTSKVDPAYNAPVMTTRRHFWQRRTRY